LSADCRDALISFAWACNLVTALETPLLIVAALPGEAVPGVSDVVSRDANVVRCLVDVSSDPNDAIYLPTGASIVVAGLHGLDEGSKGDNGCEKNHPQFAFLDAVKNLAFLVVLQTVAVEMVEG